MLRKPSPIRRATSATRPAAAERVPLIDVFSDRIAETARLGAPWPGVVGVSGGSDSLALMLLLAAWAKKLGKPPPAVLTVDHGLRKGCSATAKRVVERARALGLEAHVLRWTGDKPESDIEARARDARYRLMGAWCRKRDVAAIYLAHTLEDQAETFLLRLARGSGIDGLSGMKAVSPLPSSGQQGVMLVRPLLAVRRADLRAYLEGRGEAWDDDPMNDDPRFARARIRAAWPELEALGLLPQRLADAAAHLARAREALDGQTAALLTRITHQDDGALVIDSAQLILVPEEIGLRALASVLMRVSGQAYRPRFERLERLYGRIVAGRLTSGATLHGCRITPVTKRQAMFGPATLAIVPEKTGRRAKSKNPVETAVN
ncbi:MAG: tRNA lysidine(34) synthetase TilS [Rhizomicrobium sp.]|jgi:tRNA(Ile)-lysidine synthase